jgi:hypothetical protein
MDMDKRYVYLLLFSLSAATNDLHLIKWWDAMEQTHRPHGIWFNNINGGIIRDMKIYKVYNLS